MIESVDLQDNICSPAQQVAERFLAAMPAGCTIEIKSRPLRDSWEATAFLDVPGETARPIYRAEGMTEAHAIVKAIGPCEHHWRWRLRGAIDQP